MEKDLRSNLFFSDNERFADVVNAFGCNGVPFVEGKDLQEIDTRVNSKSMTAGKRERRKGSRYRDLLRKTRFGINFAIIGIENQEEIDYALPLRVMSYDVGAYERQMAVIRKEVRKECKGLARGEYLYGFRKSSRLFPIVTLVFYYGEEEWDGAKDIYSMLDFKDIPDGLKEKISNYHIHVIEVRKLKDTSFLKTDVKQVFDFIRFSKDKRKLKELVENDAAYQCLEEDAYDMAVSYTGDEEMFRIKEKHRKGGKINMCQGLAEWIADERAEVSEKMSRLIIVLTEQGRTEDLLRAAKDSEYREALMEEISG